MTMPARSAIVVWPAFEPVRLRLICLGYAGAGAALFQPWCEWIARDYELCAVRLPGREGRLAEPPLETLPELVGPLADEIAALPPLPFALLGICSGAVVMFETARELRRRGASTPVALIVAGQVGPSCRAARGVHEAAGLDVWERVRLFGGSDPAVLASPELMQLVEPALAADFAAVDAYVYSAEAPLECPLTAFTAAGDGIDPEEVGAWERETAARFRLRQLDADHLFSGPAWRELAFSVVEELVEGD
jgi:medium-chain acyl-[acyl-carrier-protein] hydrolase